MNEYLLELHTFHVVHDGEMLLVIVKLVQGERSAWGKTRHLSIQVDIFWVLFVVYVYRKIIE